MLDPKNLLSGLPAGLRGPLISAYEEIARNYSEHRWEPAELNGGKLCEIVYTIVDGALSGKYAPSPKKPPKMVDACKALENYPSNLARTGDRSLRILIPRLIPYLYEIRNNRNVGHVGGDVDPNFSDATAVFSCSSWLLAELVRIFHGVKLEEAQTAVDAMVERKYALVWEFEGVKRVLDPDMRAPDQVLTLLYSSSGWVSQSDLKDWTEYKNSTDFKNKVLKKLHAKRLIEYDSKGLRARLSPKGAKDVEDRILSKTIL